jgi:Tfp pilus assembly protein PilO
VKSIRRFDIRERAGLIGTILGVWFAGNLVAAFLVILPRSERAAAVQDAVSSFRQARLERERSVGALRKQYDRVMDGRRSLNTFYSDVLSTKQDRMTAVQREVREIAVKFNINPETISYAREIFEDDQIVKFSTIMPLTGSYENLRQFISAVENSDNFLTVTNVLLAGSKEGGIILSLNVSLATYFFDPDIQPKAAPGQRASLR